MTKRPRTEPRLVKASAQPPPRLHGANLSEHAYDRLEELIVSCVLRPGSFLSILDLQERTGVGRTPTHLAVNRLAVDTLIVIRPRHGLQIASIDLARERVLLRLRRDLERFVVRLATEHASASHRNQLLHITAMLRAKAARLTIDEFNQLDRRIDQLLVAAAGEAFLEHTLRPLHTISRRIGWIYHSCVCPQEGLGRTLDCHLAILDAVAAGRTQEAVAASDRLIAFCDSMFDVLGRGTDPALFDCNLEMLATG
jgi:DNA-binding GntR family transcriptional regulator